MRQVSDKGLLSRLYKELSKLNSNKTVQLEDGQKNVKRHFTKDGRKHMKSFGEIQIMVTMKYYYTLRIAKMKNSDTVKYWQRYRITGSLMQCWQEM